MVLTFISLVFGTFVSEDLACITAGLLIQRGEIGVFTGILACAVGIFMGDFGLWGVGRVFGRAALGWPWVARQLEHGRVEELQLWLKQHAAGAIVGSRFLPGTRLPLYVIAGLLKLPGVVFAVWALLGAVLWTPTIVLLTASLGDAFIARMSPIVGIGLVPGVLVASGILLLLQVGRGVLASSWNQTRIAA